MHAAGKGQSLAEEAPSPWEVVGKVAELADKLIVVGGGDPLSMEAQRNATMLFKIHLRSTLSAKRVLAEFHLSRQAFEWLLGEVDTRFQQVGRLLVRMCCVDRLDCDLWTVASGLQ